MTIPLDQFESLIDETILKRGLSYYKSGKVSDFEETGMETYQAMVEGNALYTVRLNIENNIITDYNCNCPYDMGPVCKHIVAVIFFLLEDELQISPKARNSKSKSAKKIPKKIPVNDRIQEILNKTSLDELKQFVTETAIRDKAFADILITSLAQDNLEDLKPLFKQQIKAILRSAKDRHGFIAWSSTHKVVSGLRGILGKAEAAMARGRQSEAFVIASVVLEEMTKAIQFTDDSDGHIGWAIDSALNILRDICKASPDEALRNNIMNYCIRSFKKGIYKGWDWHVDIIRVASLLTKTKNEADTLITLLEEDGLYEHEFDRTQTLIYELISKFHGQDNAAQYLADNLVNPAIRRIAIQMAIDTKDYAKAIYISMEGIQADSKKLPGLAKEWTNFLLKIAMAQNERQKVIEYARYLFIDNFLKDQDYYGILKDTVPASEWPGFYESLIAGIREKHYRTDIQQLAAIFIREQNWNRLLELLKETPDLGTVDHYATYLSGYYPVEIADLYAKGINDFLDRKVGRNHYQAACRYIRKIKKLGAKEKATNLIAELRQKYPERRALMEELDKV